MERLTSVRSRYIFVSFFIVFIFRGNNCPSSVLGVNLSSILSQKNRFSSLTPSLIIDTRTDLLELLNPSGELTVTDGGLESTRLSRLNNLVALLELSQTRKLTFPNLWQKIDGVWMLKYSNNASPMVANSAGLASRFIGSSSPQVNMLSVYQTISSREKSVNHVLTYKLPFQSSSSGEIVLHHDVSVSSDMAPAQLAIDLAEISVSGPLNPLQLPAIKLPGPSFLRRGWFDVSLKL